MGGKGNDEEKRRRDDAETTQRLPRFAKALKALSKAEDATAKERAAAEYKPKDYPPNG